jgi:capsid assembly protein
VWLIAAWAIVTGGLMTAAGFRLNVDHGGIGFRFATEDPVLGPLIGEAKAFAHEAGLSQAQFERFMSLYAASQLQQQSFISNAAKAEQQKLGVNGPQRVDAVSVWLKAHLGDDLAMPMLQTMATERQVRGWEKLIGKFSNQGGAGFSQQHRSQPDDKKIPGYENMSFEQRRQAQDRLAGR